MVLKRRQRHSHFRCPPFAATVNIHIMLHAALYPDPTHSQIFSSLPAHWLTCSRPSPHSSPGASLTTLHCCTPSGQFSKVSLRSIASWVNQLRACSSHASSWGPSLQAAPPLVMSAAISSCQRPLLSLVPKTTRGVNYNNCGAEKSRLLTTFGH